MELKIKRINKDMPLPIYKTEGSAGMDLRSTENAVIKSGKSVIVSSGISISVPRGYEAQVRPRSGLAAKHMVTVLNTPGTIDSDYRGEIKIILMNHGENDFAINKGDRIAQLVLNQIITANLVEVEELDETTRGDGGFGSTGKE